MIEIQDVIHNPHLAYHAKRIFNPAGTSEPKPIAHPLNYPTPNKPEPGFLLLQSDTVNPPTPNLYQLDYPLKYPELSVPPVNSLVFHKHKKRVKALETY